LGDVSCQYFTTCLIRDEEEI